MMKHALSFGMLTLFFSMMVFAQETKIVTEPASNIEDNSFLVEEAFNQDEHVVQHIFNAVYVKAPQENLALSFTQEWPLFSMTHQISYTIPYAFINSNVVSGFGDVLINYRYQLLKQEQWVAIAPRLSIILATGNADQGLGAGVVGWQTNIAASKQLSKSFITHVNAGMTLFPHVRSTDALGYEVRRTLTSYNLGSSIIWLAYPDINFMLEVVENYSSEINDGRIDRSSEFIVNPGLRFAVNVQELQIVPGFGVPVRVSQGETHIGAFLYLSFEHPF